MNINFIIDILNKELNVNIDASYYEKIEDWRQWWQGFNKSFHVVHDVLSDGSKKSRKLYSMKMAKKICEDWASYLLNEKTRLVVDDVSTSKWLQGEGWEGSNKGILADMNFWSESNALVEKTFYSGTGAFVLKLDGLSADAHGNIKRSPNGTLRLEYLPAQCIIPISIKYNEIIEAAFVSEVIDRGEKYVYLETHMKNNGTYVIVNRYYKFINDSYVPVSLPVGVAEVVNTGSELPFFSIIKPNIVNPYPNNNGLGASIYSEATDNLIGTDLAYNNFNQDIWLGAKKVFYNREMTKISGTSYDGTPIYISPDDVMQQLFMSVGNDIVDDSKPLMHEFNPSLRVSENSEAVQAQLDYLSFKCGMGSRQYQFNQGNTQITATQYTGERQELRQNASKHSIVLEQGIIRILKSILWVGKNILGVSVNPDSQILIEFSDSYIISDDQKKAEDIQDILNGIMQRYEYRMKWYGEDEATAKAMVNSGTDLTLFGE